MTLKFKAMRHLTIIILLTVQSVFCMVYSQSLSYNMTRASECLENKDIYTAKEYLNKELQDSPRSVAGLDLLGYIYFSDGDYRKAISLFDKAIEYAGKKDREELSLVYFHRAGLYAVLGDTIRSISDYKKSISLDKGNIQALAELADMYFYYGDYSNSNSIYKQLMKLDSGNPYPYYGVARNDYTNNDFDKARKEISKGELLDTDKERVNIMRMRVEILAKNYTQALDYAIKVIKENKANSEAYANIINLTDTIYHTVVDEITKQRFFDKENEIWSILLGHIYMQNTEYNKAIECFAPIVNSDSEYKLFAIYMTAICDDYLYKDEDVINLMNTAIAIDSTDADFYYHRAYASFFIQDYKLAERDFKKVMEIKKEYSYFCYYMLGWIKEMKRDYKAALTYYDMSIELNSNYAYSYMMKGFLLKDYFDDTKGAEQAFLKCIELDKGIEQGTCRQYAYAGLGQYDKAMAISDSIIAKFGQDAGTYYDAACLYSRMGKISESINYLRICLEKGYSRINHIESDNDLDNIRMSYDYQILLEKYKNKKKLYKKDNIVCLESSEVLEMPFKVRSNGTYMINCSFNELPVDFIIDTGSTNVSHFLCRK